MAKKQMELSVAEYHELQRLVNIEIDYLAVFDVSTDPKLCRALGALYTLQEYIPGAIASAQEVKQYLD